METEIRVPYQPTETDLKVLNHLVKTGDVPIAEYMRFAPLSLHIKKTEIKQSVETLVREAIVFPKSIEFLNVHSENTYLTVLSNPFVEVPSILEE